MDKTIDPTIKALVSALGEAETGTSSPEAYARRGASGEFGRYQFMPDTWRQYASEAGVSSPLEQSSIEDQNKVAYHKISQWKQQGYNPAQIASMWNAGPGKPNAYKEGWKGVNAQGVAYDTPSYAQKVSDAYRRLKGTVYTGGKEVPNDVPAQGGTFFGDVGKTLSEAGTKIATAVQGGPNGDYGIGSRILQGVGGAAGAVGGLASDVLHHIPGVKQVVGGIEGAIGQGVQAVADTDIGQAALQKYGEFADAHPEAAANIGAGFDIATAVPVLKGVGVAKNAVKGAIGTALRGSADDVLGAVAKDLGPVARKEAILRRGTERKGFMRVETLKPDPREVKIAGAVRANVPGFNPSKPLLTNISKTQTAVDELAANLKASVQESGKDRIYSFRELSSRLKKIEMPDIVAADATLKNLYKRVIDRAMKLAQKKGGKVSHLLDVRRDFDAAIKRQYPNLYRSDQLTPIRQVVRDVREVLNDFTAQNLPDLPNFREDLLTQSDLIRALENMAEKAAKGEGRELGTTAVDRFMGRHPVIRGVLRAGKQAAIQGTGVGGAMKILD